MRKGSHPMESYISSCRELLNHLIVVGDNITAREKVMYVIGRLDGNYSSLVTTVSNKRREISIDEFFSMMTTNEK